MVRRWIARDERRARRPGHHAAASGQDLAVRVKDQFVCRPGLNDAARERLGRQRRRSKQRLVGRRRLSRRQRKQRLIDAGRDLGAIAEAALSVAALLVLRMREQIREHPQQHDEQRRDADEDRP